MMTAGPYGGPMSNNDGPMGQRMPGNDVGMGRPPPSRDQSNKIDDFFVYEDLTATCIFYAFLPRLIKIILPISVDLMTV